MKKIVQKIIVAGVVVDSNKVLIVQRGADEEIFPNLWEIPSGKREPFEKSKDAVAREVEEETGVKVKPIMPVDVFEFKVEKEDEVRDATQISFLCKPVGKPKVKLSPEHQNFAWIGESELDDYNLSKETKRAISKVFKILKNEKDKQK